MPAAVERQQRTDLKEPAGDVEGAGYLGPVLQIFQALPFGVAVIDDEKLAAFRSVQLRSFCRRFEPSGWRFQL